MVAHAEHWVQQRKVARRRTHRNYSAGIKRALDIALSAGALAFLSPGLLLIAVILFAIDGGPVIYRHDRVGKNGDALGRRRAGDVDVLLDRARHTMESPQHVAGRNRCRRARRSTSSC